MKVPIDKVVGDLKEMFEIDVDNEFGSSESENKFHIDKRQFGRLLVIDMLQEYFKDKTIEDGYLKMEGITFVHTVFEVLKGKPY